MKIENVKNLTMNELVSTLNEWAYNYYVLDNPTVADKEYDLLYDRLLELEKAENKVLSTSPTRRVGGEVLKGFEKHTHLKKLFSLDKGQSREEIRSFCDKVTKAYDNQKINFTVEYKFDGLTACLFYDEGKFVRATTRGNGELGEDVTQQILTIKTFPLEISYKGKLEVVGECVMLLSDLEKYNLTADVPLKNARNAVAGAIRNLDPKETARRKPQIFFYSINFIEDDFILTQTQTMSFLKENKFKVSDMFEVCENFEQISKIIDKIEEKRGELDFLIDGLVIKVDDFQIRESLGVTEKFPKWAIAFKFEAEEATTVLKDVVWQVGRTGKLTPLAILDEVDLCGVTVKRATLNNYQDIERKNVRINDSVFIRRSNDVIPEILGLAERGETSEKIEKISKCPACQSQLKEIGAHLFCLNSLNCKPQIVQKITHFASKNAMNIVGFSEKTASSLFENLNVRKTADLYKLKGDDLLELEGFKDKKIENLLSAIEKSKEIRLDKFIFALGISNVGAKTAKDLAKRFKTIENLKNATIEELLTVEDVGEIVGESIVDFFANGVEMDNLELLLKEMKFNHIEEVKAGGVFENMTFVVTGTLENFSRTEAKEMIEKHGGKVSGSVSKKTNCVLFGVEAGSKLDKAVALNIKTMNESEFLEKIKG